MGHTRHYENYKIYFNNHVCQICIYSEFLDIFSDPVKIDFGDDIFSRNVEIEIISNKVNNTLVYTLVVDLTELPYFIESLKFQRNTSYNRGLKYKVILPDRPFKNLRALHVYHAHFNVEVNKERFPKLKMLSMCYINTLHSKYDLTGMKLKTLVARFILDETLACEHLKTIRAWNCRLNLDNFPNARVEFRAGVIDKLSEKHSDGVGIYHINKKETIWIVETSENKYQDHNTVIKENSPDTYITKDVLPYIDWINCRDLVIDPRDKESFHIELPINIITMNSIKVISPASIEIISDKLPLTRIEFVLKIFNDRPINQELDLCILGEYFNYVEIEKDHWFWEEINYEETIDIIKRIIEALNYYKCKDEVKVELNIPILEDDRIIRCPKRVYEHCKHLFKYRIPNNIRIKGRENFNDDLDKPEYTSRAKSARK